MASRLIIVCVAVLCGALPLAAAGLAARAVGRSIGRDSARGAERALAWIYVECVAVGLATTADLFVVPP